MVMKKHNYKKGSLLIEAVVSVSVALLMLLAIIGTFSLTLRSAIVNSDRAQAAYLEEEGLEIIRILRDDSWNGNIASHSSGTNFYLGFNGTTWKATTTDTYIDNIFERKAVLTDVYRDNNQNIVSSGGTLDTKTKKATISVSWSSAVGTTTKSISTYFTNIFNN